MTTETIDTKRLRQLIEYAEHCSFTGVTCDLPLLKYARDTIDALTARVEGLEKDVESWAEKSHHWHGEAMSLQQQLREAEAGAVPDEEVLLELFQGIYETEWDNYAESSNRATGFRRLAENHAMRCGIREIVRLLTATPHKDAGGDNHE